MSNLIPDLVPAVKAWITALGVLPGGIYYRLPVKPKVVPFGRLSRSGGGPEFDSEIPFARLTVLIEIWGMANSDYEVVRAAALQLEQAIHAVNGPNLAGADTGVRIVAANVLTGFDSPDPDTGWPRYVLSASFVGRGV